MTITFDQALATVTRTEREASEARDTFLAKSAAHRRAIQSLERLAESDDNLKRIRDMGLLGQTEAVKQVIERTTDSTWAQVCGTGRTKADTYWRRVVIFVLREMGLSQGSVGSVLGGRDHSTILYSERRTSEDEQAVGRRVLQDVRRILRGRG